MSFGGSGIVANCVALAILLRVDWENRQLMRGAKIMSKTLLVMAAEPAGTSFPVCSGRFCKSRGWNVVWMGNPDGIRGADRPPRGYEMAWVRFGALRGKGLLRKLCCRSTCSPVAGKRSEMRRVKARRRSAWAVTSPFPWRPDGGVLTGRPLVVP